MCKDPGDQSTKMRGKLSAIGQRSFRSDCQLSHYVMIGCG